MIRLIGNPSSIIDMVARTFCLHSLDEFKGIVLSSKARNLLPEVRAKHTRFLASLEMTESLIRFSRFRLRSFSGFFWLRPNHAMRLW